MVRWLVLGVIAFILYKLVTNEMVKRKEKNAASRTAETKSKAATGEMVKDPVCGVYVDVSSTVSVRDGAVIHRFCSYECRDAFLEQLRGAGREIPANKTDDSNV